MSGDTGRVDGADFVSDGEVVAAACGDVMRGRGVLHISQKCIEG